MDNNKMYEFWMKIIIIISTVNNIKVSCPHTVATSNSSGEGLGIDVEQLVMVGSI